MLIEQKDSYVFSFTLFWDWYRLRPLLNRRPKLYIPIIKLSKESICIGWGNKQSGLSAALAANNYKKNLLKVEDGFLRSVGLGIDKNRGYSIVVDDLGIYYDAQTPSRLETILNNVNFTQQDLLQAQQTLNTLKSYQLSKYNNSPCIKQGFFNKNTGDSRILLIDQTFGDESIKYGLGSKQHFRTMLSSAIQENPDASIWIKTHPDVLTGKKQGHFDYQVLKQTYPHIQWLTENWNIQSILAHFNKVYVVTSQVGFDALIAGKQVVCFGMPFYAGWGLTEDRQTCPRRKHKRSLLELIAAAYIHYSLYVNLETNEAGTFSDVATFIIRQRQYIYYWYNSMTFQNTTVQPYHWSGKVFCFGFRYWKHAHVRPFFGEGTKLVFVNTVEEAHRHHIAVNDHIAVWGQKFIDGLDTLASQLQIPITRVEDGFLRSVGLGADFVRPMSLVFDQRGIYFDPSIPSELEHILNNEIFTPELLKRAANIRQKITEARLTKYNTDYHPLDIHLPKNKVIILVPGQVEDDASILKGAAAIKTNIELLQAARLANPEAFIIYKPHPDVLAGNRIGNVDATALLGWCDHIEYSASVIDCIEKSHEIHTITSLTGFDALLRSKKIVTYGSPFYAGWGLTIDHVKLERRQRQLQLDELVAGALLLYPRYWDTKAQGFVECETIIERLIAERERKQKQRSLLPKQWQRQIRKWTAFAQGSWQGWLVRRQAKS